MSVKTKVVGFVRKDITRFGESMKANWQALKDPIVWDFKAIALYFYSLIKTLAIIACVVGVFGAAQSVGKLGEQADQRFQLEHTYDPLDQ